MKYLGFGALAGLLSGLVLWFILLRGLSRVRRKGHIYDRIGRKR